MSKRREEAIRFHFERSHPDHLIVLARIRSRTVFRDEFGDLIETRWHSERDKFIVDKLDYTELDLTETDVREIVERLVDAASSPDEPADASPNAQALGRTFEESCANALMKSGYAVELRGGSGDQGADIIGTKDGLRIAFQCKFRNAAVTNEALAARQYYDCDKATVISNQTFTVSARQLADKCDISLISLDDISG